MTASDSRVARSELADESGPGRVHSLLANAAKVKAHKRQWERSYRNRAIATDAIAVISAVMVAQFGRFGMPHLSGANVGAWIEVTLYSIGLAEVWLATLGLQQSWDFSIVGAGSEEYRRVVTATAWVFGMIAAAGLIFQAQMARGYLVIALPAGLVLLVLGRHLLRRDLSKKRIRGDYFSHVVVLGKPHSIVTLCDSLDRAKTAGYSVIGACVPNYDGNIGAEVNTGRGRVPVFGDEDCVEIALQLTNADALAVAAVEHLGHDRMRKLAWRLDALNVDMIVVPGITDIAGPRLKVLPIDNLPLFRLARPRRDALAMGGKRIFDLAVASAALVLLFPLMLVAAVAVKLCDGGPVFFRQERVGYQGRRFVIMKFRTMLVGSDSVKDAEQAAAGQTNEIFYKSAMDSRITRTGRFLRKNSIDELPQLFNVLAGSMSIVGPRPLVPGEGNSVEYFTERRALVKPGMTGLWQISGRSDISAEERIRLDHSYIDNWSFVQDAVIVLRTLRAVLNRQGAY
jgi:exopolysaccharide biosynthesis polyprenyl glycosylphosphotransferase